MSPELAATKADRLIELLITHQPNMFSANGWLFPIDSPQHVAKHLAELRLHLVAHLSAHPD
jgi:hypothetical protein